MKPDGSLKVLHNFTGGSDGGRAYRRHWCRPPTGTCTAPNTLGGRANGNGFGVLFRATLAGDVVPLHDFSVNPATGVNTICPLLQHTNGILYGETNAGGAYGLGGFYSLDAGLPPFVTYLPTYGRAGALVQILGQGFTDASEVFFNGTPATLQTRLSHLYPGHCAGWSHQRTDHRHHREWHTDQQQAVHCASIDRHADATGPSILITLCIEARPTLSGW